MVDLTWERPAVISISCNMLHVIENRKQNDLIKQLSQARIKKDK